MAAKLDDLLPAIIAKKDSGLSFGAMKTKFAGKPSEGEALLRNALASLVDRSEVWGPFKYRASQLYFAAGHGPSIETASRAIESLVSRAGVKLLSRAALEKKVTGMNARFFADGIKHAIASRTLLELSCGRSKYYLHRGVAADYLGLVAESPDQTIEPVEPAPAGPNLTMERLLPIYRRLKAEQGGFSAVKNIRSDPSIGWIERRSASPARRRGEGRARHDPSDHLGRASQGGDRRRYPASRFFRALRHRCGQE